MQAHYRAKPTADSSVELGGLLGAVQRLDGRLMKQSGLHWQPRAARVDNLQFIYQSRHGDTKSIGASRTLFFSVRSRRLF